MITKVNNYTQLSRIFISVLTTVD